MIVIPYHEQPLLIAVDGVNTEQPWPLNADGQACSRWATSI